MSIQIVVAAFTKNKENTPGRPIISAHSCPTVFIAEYIDSILQPIVQYLPSFIKDTTHALQIFKGFHFRGSQRLLFSMDVCSLYTSIPHEEGLVALKYFLDQRREQSPSSATILRLTELVLTLNHFVFNSEHYLQIKGVAMGSKIGPGYACIVLDTLKNSYSHHTLVLPPSYINGTSMILSASWKAHVLN